MKKMQDVFLSCFQCLNNKAKSVIFIFVQLCMKVHENHKLSDVNRFHVFKVYLVLQMKYTKGEFLQY